MEYQIFQVMDTREHGWMGLSERGEILKTDELDMALYYEVYAGEVEPEGADPYPVLEDLFRIFNLEHPEDFRGHSMSVGDLIQLRDRLFYCDSCGFVDVTDRVIDSNEIGLECLSISPGGEVATDA